MQVLCIQLQRVICSASGRLIKISGPVRFPEVLDLATFTSAAAEPMLPQRRRIPSQPAPLGSAIFPRTYSPAACTHLESGGILAAVSSAQEAAIPGAGSRDSREDADKLAQDAACSSAVCLTADGQCCGEDTGAAGPPEEASSSVDRQPVHVSSSAGQGLNMAASTRYSLIAAVMHHGSAQSGHYTAYRKVPSQADTTCSPSSEQPWRVSDSRRMYEDHFSRTSIGFLTETRQRWAHASDERVRAADLEEVLDCEATVLFYERCFSPHEARSIWLS